MGYIFDYPCIIPNAIGIVFGIIQVAGYFYIKAMSPQPELESAAEEEDEPPRMTKVTACLGGNKTKVTLRVHTPESSLTRQLRKIRFGSLLGSKRSVSGTVGARTIRAN